MFADCISTSLCARRIRAALAGTTIKEGKGLPRLALGPGGTGRFAA